MNDSIQITKVKFEDGKILKAKKNTSFVAKIYECEEDGIVKYCIYYEPLYKYSESVFRKSNLSRINKVINSDMERFWIDYVESDEMKPANRDFGERLQAHFQIVRKK